MSGRESHIREKQLLSPEDVARACGLSRRAVYRAIARGELPAARRRRGHGQRDATLISVLAYAGLRPQEALAMRWADVRERTLLIEKASDGQGDVKLTKTRHSRTVRLLAALAHDLAEWRLLCGRPEADALVSPTSRAASGTTGPGRRGTATPGLRPAAAPDSPACVRMTCATASSRC